MSTKRSRTLAGLILAAAMLAGAPALAANVLTIGKDQDSTTFDPIKSAQNADFWVFANVYDVLVRVDKTGTKLEPGLAESWTVSDDGLVYTFKMRDAKFSDGSPITAKDAAFTLTRHPRRQGLAVGRLLQEHRDAPKPRTTRRSS